MRVHSARIRESEGATASEWALIVFLIALAIIAAVTVFGLRVKDLFDSVPAF